MIQDVLGFYVKPEYLYQTWVQDINNGDFELSKVMDSLNSFEHTVATSSGSNEFKGLFSSSIIDLTDSALGTDLHKRSKNIRDLIMLFADLNMVDLQEDDILGDAYEYLIGKFASDAGKKAGEFYTPKQVSEVMAQIVSRATPNMSSIYDPTVGSGSLLLTVKKYLSKEIQRDLDYYGQEFITETYNLTRMNLLLHGVRPEKMHIKNGNTLAQDWPEDPENPNEGVQFDGVVMNPPYSDQRWNKREDKPLKVSDPRFSDFGVLPPDSKGDFAYLMHGLYHLNSEGTMAIVLPHGVLFRGSSEGEIRKRLLEKNYIDAIIGLPSNLFTNTGIPVSVIILKKNRPLSAPVLIINAGNEFIKVGKQNVLQERDTAKIVDTYMSKEEIPHYSHLATREEIIANDYNLNIPRYVEELNEEVPHDVDAHLYGGIPKENIADLELLQTLFSDIIADGVTPIREGYVSLTTPVGTLKQSILSDTRLKETSEKLKTDIDQYIQKYWNALRHVSSDMHSEDLKRTMLQDIKELLSEYSFLDGYQGYQIISDIWKQALSHDIELIAKSDFYEVGRTREARMVTKGTGAKKREEQDGWVGAIIPNHLIMMQLFKEDLESIEQSQSQLSDIDSELSNLVEEAKDEDSDVYNTLYPALKKNDEDEPQDSFENKLVKSELKETVKNSTAYHLLKQVDSLIADKSKKTKEIKEKEIKLKEDVYNRIEALTNEEIDCLVYERWFGDTQIKMKQLLLNPILKELNQLEMLDKRYADTLSMIDDTISSLEEEFNQLLNELVVE